MGPPAPSPAAEGAAAGLPESPAPTGSAWVVEDEIAPGEGQVRKGELLATLESTACAAADAELAGLGLTTQGCPYLGTLFAYLRRQSAERLGSLLRQVAPAGASLSVAATAVVAQVRAATARWAQTGEVSGLPAGIPSSTVLSALGAGSLAGGLGGLADLGGVFFKGEGGASGVAGVSGGAAPSSPAGALATQARLGPGRPLPGAVRGPMEGAFGTSFSGVRVHTDSRAAALSSRMGARAFAVGTDVAFGAGEYRPGTPTGDALLAHELAHVLQQRHAGPSVAPSGASAGGRLESDADQSAVGAVVRLWMGLKGGLKDLPAVALPRLKTGLRLQHCSCDKSKYPLPSGKVPEQASNLACSSPTPTTLKAVRKVGGPSALGFTHVKHGGSKLSVSKSFDGSCNFTIRRPEYHRLESYVYTQPGTYDNGTERRKRGPCPKKDLKSRLHITAAVAEVIKKGEIEHCEDFKRAWALSRGRYNVAYGDLAKGFCSENEKCMPVASDRFKSRIGVSLEDKQKVARCLFKKTHERDTNGWHSLRIVLGKKATYDKKCTTVTYTPTVDDLGEVGKHPTNDLIQGCGE